MQSTSCLTLEQALQGKNIPAQIKNNLALIEVPYWSFDSRNQYGQLIVHQNLAQEVRAIFTEICEAHFPITKVLLIAEYDWSDDASMADNNSSAFNYRKIAGENRLSQHAFGRAIDINPCLNPYVKGDLTLPPHAVYEPDVPGTITQESVVVKAFAERGWDWGGNWQRLKDWHHFEKRE